MTHPIASMTGFARADGQQDGIGWTWELRSVNGRTLDLRFRLPPGCDQLEPGLRDAAARHLRRGTVNATLTLRRDDAPRLAPDEAALDQALALALALQARIPGSPPPRAEALLALPGILRAAQPDTQAPIPPAIATSFTEALAALAAARADEGARLGAILHAQLDEIAALHAAATREAADQPAAQRARLLENLNALLRDAPPVPEDRLAQEIALLATRSDVREELDRLASHIAAARALLAEGSNIGRRLDFLLQEFNREANTLCSKSASTRLTTTGLALKAALEQLREQVQNIE